MATGARGTVMLGHGFGTDRSVWRELEPLIVRRGFQVVSYNLTYVGSVADAFDLNGEGFGVRFQKVREEAPGAAPPGLFSEIEKLWEQGVRFREIPDE